jgi:hypothetical protein
VDSKLIDIDWTRISIDGMSLGITTQEALSFPEWSLVQKGYITTKAYGDLSIGLGFLIQE